jgi:hypothetical protein
MNMLGTAFHRLLVWTGLAEASESHLTPSHGWLLPTAAEAQRQRQVADAHREERERRNARA